MIEAMLMSLLLVVLGAVVTADTQPIVGGIVVLSATITGALISSPAALWFCGLSFLAAPWIADVAEKRGFLEPRRR